MHFKTILEAFCFSHSFSQFSWLPLLQGQILKNHKKTNNDKFHLNSNLNFLSLFWKLLFVTSSVLKENVRLLEKLFPKLDNRTQSGSLLVNKKSTNQENLLKKLTCIQIKYKLTCKQIRYKLFCKQIKIQTIL